MPVPRLKTRLALCIAATAFCALAACQTAGGGAVVTRSANLVVGDERLAECVARSCARLNLDGASLADYSRLAALSHVTALMLSYTDFDSLGEIAPMQQLTELHIGQSNVDDLSGLADFPNLTLLHAQVVPVADFSPIAAMTGLRELALGGPRIERLDFVAPLRGLERLHLSYLSAGVDLSALARHPGLREVHLDVDGDTDLGVFLTMPRLAQLSITAYPGAEMEAQIAQLRARGVTVDLDEPVMVVC